MAVRMDPNVTTAAGQNKPAQVDANDFRQFAAMRRADPNDPQTLRQVSRQFESIFTKMMLEGMRNASFGDPMFGSDQSDMYQGMMDDQMAVQLTSGRGIGLADMLFKQLSQGRDGGSAPFDAVTAAMPARTAGTNIPEGPVVDDAQRRRFVEEMLPHARTAGAQLGVDERSVIAQMALETGWGTSKPADASGTSNNFLGIKAGASWHGDSVVSDTTEYTRGVAGTEQGRFRAYGSVAENLSDYVRLLSSRYASALNTGSDVQAFGNALQRGGYATDPRYAEKLAAVAAKIESLDVKSFKSGDTSPIERRPTNEEPIRTARTEGNG